MNYTYKQIYIKAFCSYRIVKFERFCSSDQSKVKHDEEDVDGINIDFCSRDDISRLSKPDKSILAASTWAASCSTLLPLQRFSLCRHLVNGCWKSFVNSL